MLYISCPSPQNSHLFKEPWLLLLEIETRNQDRVPGVLVASQLSSILGTLNGYSEKAYACELNCVYILIYKYFYM